MAKVARGRTILDIPDDKISDAVALGYEPVGDAEAKRTQAVTEAATIGGGIQGAGEAIARGASLGFSDSALRALGVDSEGLAARSEGLGSKALEVAGAVAPALLSGGSSAVGSAARLTLAGRAAQVGRAITGATEAAAGRGLVARAGGAALAGGFEGALAGAGQAASELALGDKDLAAEHLLAGARRNAGLGALFGAGATTLGIGLEHAYRGTRRVASGAVERALGAGDDASTAAGRASMTGGSVMERAAARQVELLGGSADDVAAMSRHLSRTRTAEGRTLMELAGKGGSAVDDAVGARLRSTVGRTSAKRHTDAWASSLDGAGGKVVQRQADDAVRALKGVSTPAAKEARRLLKVQAARVPKHGAYADARDELEALIARGREVGDAGVEQVEAAARSYLDSAADPALWGAGVEGAGAVRAAARAEQEALAGLSPKARKALDGEIDDAGARALAKDSAALIKVLDARAAQADALERVGQDVSELRTGIDDVRKVLKYRDDVTVAADDAVRLRALEEGTGAIARKGLEVGGRALGSVLGGLSFGGAALGEAVGQVLGAATRPAMMIRSIARARAGIDAVRAKQGEAVAAFGRLADGAGDVARGTAKAARRVPPAVSRQQQRDRQRETLDTLSRVMRMASDPKEVAKEMGPALLPLREAAPNVAGAVMAGAARAAAYLAAVAPPTYRPTGAGDVTMVDPFALESWRRKAEAVMEPTVALLDLAGGGTLTKDEARAIATVYPKMWAEFQRDIMKQVGQRARDGQPLSFKARNALGVIGGVAADDSLRPADFASIQASMSVKPPHPPAPPPRSQIKPTAPSLPKWQRIEEQA